MQLRAAVGFLAFSWKTPPEIFHDPCPASMLFMLMVPEASIQCGRIKKEKSSPTVNRRVSAMSSVSSLSSLHAHRFPSPLETHQIATTLVINLCHKPYTSKLAVALKSPCIFDEVWRSLVCCTEENIGATDFNVIVQQSVVNRL